jgi:hypothetical protein
VASKRKKRQLLGVAVVVGGIVGWHLMGRRR